MRTLSLSCLLMAALLAPVRAADPKPLKLLFLGDDGPHRPAERFRQLQPVLLNRGIDLTYTDKADALSAKVLAGYDGLVIYANITSITPEQETALLDYVAGGKGFIPLHCASYCFHNSPKYIDLVGAQFQRHGTGTFRTTVAKIDHPILKGFGSFESYDETYVHTKHNEKDRTVLEHRVDRNAREPWTWVRTHGRGRVFYTAWGHDARTWGHPGFQNLVERGIRWAVGASLEGVPEYVEGPQLSELRKDVKPFEYVEANVPFYPPGQRGGPTREGIKQMQKPLETAESMKHMVHPTSLELKLFVDENRLGGKPICMNWDERGRLWVAVTADYPNELQARGSGRDRLIICEDTDGDGTADKVTLFADKLSIPTSLLFSQGGVVVHQAPDTLFLKDTDGDGKADERKVLFTGWHTNDTHAGPSNLRYGLDNWVYGMVGYAGFDGDVGGKFRRFRTGFYRFKPDVSDFEFLRNTNNNSWGVGFSEEGLLFGSTANGCPSVYLPIPNRYYEGVRGWSSSVLQSIAATNQFHPITEKVRQVDFHGGFTAAAGHALYTARAYPKMFWNRTAFVAEPTGHLTATFVLQRNGTDFQANYGWNLLASDDEWTSPIVAEVGPDGNVWMIDWYNFIVQHNPTPAGFKTGKGAAYETELRDKTHGRIYRLVAKDAKAPKTTLADATPEQLVATLKSDNMFWRLHAQRLLVERGKADVVPALVKLIAEPSVDEIGLNGGVTHALWTLHGLGLLDGKNTEVTTAVVTALRHKSAGVRRNAVLVLPRTGDSIRAILDGGLLEDADAHVRLAALLALAEMPASADAGKAVLSVLDRQDNLSDRWVPDAATAAAAAHDAHFLAAVVAKKQSPAQRALDIVGIVSEHYARGGPKTVGKIVASLTDADPKVADAVLGGLSRGWPRNKPVELTDDAEKALAGLLVKLSAAGKGRLLQLASSWGVKSFDKAGEEVANSLLAVVADAKQSTEQRSAAARQVIEFRPDDPRVLAALLDVVSPRTPPQLAADLLDAVGKSTSADAGKAVLERMPTWPPAARAAAVRVLVSRPESVRVLLNAIDEGQVQLGELTLDQKQSLAAHPDRQLADRTKKLLARGGALPSPDRQKVIEEWLALTKKTGDVARGKAIFTKHCAACHKHGDLGNFVGPELTGMNVHPKEELLTQVLDPNRSVEGNFRAYVLTLRDGRTLTGLLASETNTSVELVDSQAKRFVLQRADIEELGATTKSVMPEGFEKQMNAEEMTDLLEFLTQRGKYVPLPLAKVATITSVKGMFFGEESTVERLIFPDWKPKTFEGVPFLLVDPQGGKTPNVVLLYGPQGSSAPKMPKSVSLPVNGPAKAIHFLSGVSGWGFPMGRKGSVSMIVRLHYDDGKTEDHELKNGEHFADYIRRVDVPESKFAFALRGQQIRYFAVTPKRTAKIERLELVKGDDASAPVVMGVTVETP